MKSDKMISGIKCINSLRIQACILRNVRNWLFSLGHFVTQKYQYLMNGSRYDQIRSTGLQKTYINISEEISYCIDWKIVFVWLFTNPTPTHRTMIQAILLMKFQSMPINNTLLSKLIIWIIIKNVKAISGVNYIDSLHIKWCALKIWEIDHLY